MSEVFHLGLTKAMLKGAKVAIVPGILPVANELPQKWRIRNF